MPEERFIQELSGHESICVIGGELHTPALDGAILPGITRDSVITLGRHWALPCTNGPWRSTNCWHRS